jgi:hypothetical protein
MLTWVRNMCYRQEKERSPHLFLTNSIRQPFVRHSNCLCNHVQSDSVDRLSGMLMHLEEAPFGFGNARYPLLCKKVALAVGDNLQFARKHPWMYSVDAEMAAFVGMLIAIVDSDCNPNTLRMDIGTVLDACDGHNQLVSRLHIGFSRLSSVQFCLILRFCIEDSYIYRASQLTYFGMYAIREFFHVYRKDIDRNPHFIRTAIDMILLHSVETIYANSQSSENGKWLQSLDQSRVDSTYETYIKACLS